MSAYTSNKTQSTKIPALIKLNAPGLNVIVLSNTIPYKGAEARAEMDSTDEVKANILPI